MNITLPWSRNSKNFSDEILKKEFDAFLAFTKYSIDSKNFSLKTDLLSILQSVQKLIDTKVTEWKFNEIFPSLVAFNRVILDINNEPITNATINEVLVALDIFRLDLIKSSMTHYLIWRVSNDTMRALQA